MSSDWRAMPFSRSVYVSVLSISLTNRPPKLPAPSPSEMLWELLLPEDQLREVHKLPWLNLLWAELGILFRELVDQGGMARENSLQGV